MQITQNSEEFLRLLNSLVDDLVSAQIHFKLLQDLYAAMPEYSEEFGQSWTFWSLTLEAHMDSVVQRLCRAYDQRGGSPPSLNLRNLLDTIEANVHFFDEEDFCHRLKGNPFVESLAETARRPDPAQLAMDKESVNTSAAQVKRLVVWRNEFFAHRNSARVLEDEIRGDQSLLLIADIEKLLANGLGIVNRYSSLFIATTHSTNIVGHDDYLSVLKSVRESLRAYEAKVQEEINRLT